MGVAVDFAEMLTEIKAALPGASLAEIARGLERGGISLSFADLRLAAEDWSQHQGEKGGTYWVRKGDSPDDPEARVYQKENPGQSSKEPVSASEAKTLPPEKPAPPVVERTEPSPPPDPDKTKVAGTAGTHALPAVPEGHAIVSSGHGTMHPTYHVTAPDGKKLFAKQPRFPAMVGHKPHPKAGQHQPAQVDTEIAASNILRLIGVDAPEASKLKSGEGHLLTTPLLENQHTLYDEYTHDRHLERVQKANSPKELTRMYLGEWLLDANDRHMGNYLVDKGTGKLTPIDYGVSFYPHEENEYIAPQRNSLLAMGVVSPHDRLDREVLARVVAERPRIEAEAAKLVPHYGDRADKMMASLKGRLDRVAELAKKPKATVGDLQKSTVWEDWFYRGEEA